MHLSAETTGVAEPSHPTTVGLEQAVGLVGLPALQFGQTQVVVAPFEDRERRLAPEVGLNRLGEARQVVVDELVLEREGRGRYHHGRSDQQCWHQVRQRLSGAGAGLHEQVLAVGHGAGDRRRHGPLTRPADPAGDRVHRGIEEFLHRRRGLLLGHGQ